MPHFYREAGRIYTSLRLNGGEFGDRYSAYLKW